MEEKILKKSHSVMLDDRKHISLSGITATGSFDENTVELYTDYGMVILKGENIQVTCIDTDTGKFEAEGKFCAIIYNEDKKKHQSFVSRVFR